MITLSCPRCGDPVRLPDQVVPVDSTVRCNWCQETYTLAEISRDIPPELEIVSMGTGSETLPGGSIDLAAAHSMAGATDDVGRTTLAGSVDDSQEEESLVEIVPPLEQFELAEQIEVEEVVELVEPEGVLELEESREEINIFEEVGEAASAESLDVPAGELELAPLKPMKVGGQLESSIRPSLALRKERSTVKTILGVVAAGLLAFPIGSAILALVGRPLPIDLGVWPFNGADQGSVSRVTAAPVSPTPKISKIQKPTKPQSFSTTLDVPERIASVSETNAASDALAAISGMNAKEVSGSEAIAPETTIEELQPGFALPDPKVMKESLTRSELPIEVSELVTKSNELLTASLGGLGDPFEPREGVKFYRRASILAEALTADTVKHDSTNQIAGMLNRIRGTKLEEFVHSASSQWIQAPADKRGIAGMLVLGTATRNSNGQTFIELAKGAMVQVDNRKGVLPVEGKMIGLATIDSSSGAPKLSLSVSIENQ